MTPAAVAGRYISEASYGPSPNESSLCQARGGWLFFGAREVGPLFGLSDGRSVVGGSGSDFTEEPAVRDAEPVALVSSRSRLSSRTLLLRAVLGVGL